MHLLQIIPESVLWLLDCNPWAKQNLIRKAETLGISAHRLIFAPRVNLAEHLARHVHADLFLDTQPYNAHTTCSDALWMGVPVLTCAGSTFSARVAGSLLKAAGLPQLVTHSLDAYTQQALHLAKNPELLMSLKQQLLNERRNSALFDTARFTQDLEQIYMQMLDTDRDR